jgi:hypothetical protein
MLLAVAILVGAALIAWAVARRSGGDAAQRADAARSRQLAIIGAFAPAIAAAADDPRAIAVWQPVARMARALLADDFAAIDRAYGAPFPFSPATIRDAHAKWSTEWLSWERSHDVEFKRRAALAAPEPGAPASASIKATLDAIENEKLELYQRRYAEYVRVAKALQALAEG